MDTTYWPHELHMVVQSRVHSRQHRPSVGLYKVDQFVEEFSIEFSCVSLIQELFLFPTLRNKFITLYLSRFDFTLKYVLGTKIRKTDRLSRGPDQKVSVEKNNENHKLIKEKWIHSLEEVVIEEYKVNILEKVLKGNEWQIESELVLKKGKIYMPNVTNQRSQSRSIEKILYWVNTRELNRELCTRWSILYINT